MNRMILWLFAAISVVAGVSLPPMTCSTYSPVTHTWNAACSNYTNPVASCWIPQTLPNSSSVVRFAAGTNVTISVTEWHHFNLSKFRTVIIAEGATVTMTGAAFVVTECFVVEGSLKMSQGNQTGGNPLEANWYYRDTGIPQSTDCASVSGGFLPRICGPGVMLIVGDVTVSQYSSLWLGAVVSNKGRLNVIQGFMWGNLTNYGVLVTQVYSYLHGFLYNYGNASLETLTFDKWAKWYEDSPPILIENFGELLFRSALYATTYNYTTSSGRQTGNYKAVIVNRNSVTFQCPEATIDVDFFNYGNATWKGAGTLSFHGGGSYINRGTFIADHTNVYLNMFSGSAGSRLVMLAGGQFFFGHAGMSSRPLRICSVRRPAKSQPAERTSDILKPPQQNEGGDPCVSFYLGKCLMYHYIFRAQTPRMVLPPRNEVPLHQAPVLIELDRIVSADTEDLRCEARYAFGDVFIGGDGTGAVVTTLPSNVYGTVTIGKGGKWIMIAEHHTSPVWGAGTVRVAKLGELHVGIDATLDNHNSFVVEEGGLMTVPKHADVSLTNTTVTIRRGGILHVDGRLHQVSAFAELHRCGELRGAGQIRLAGSALPSSTDDC